MNIGLDMGHWAGLGNIILSYFLQASVLINFAIGSRLHILPLLVQDTLPWLNPLLVALSDGKVSISAVKSIENNKNRYTSCHPFGCSAQLQLCLEHGLWGKGGTWPNDLGLGRNFSKQKKQKQKQKTFCICIVEITLWVGIAVIFFKVGGKYCILCIDSCILTA